MESDPVTKFILGSGKFILRGDLHIIAPLYLCFNSIQPHKYTFLAT